MKFGALPPAKALGAINVHTLRAGARVIKKGRVLSEDDVASLESAGIAEVTDGGPTVVFECSGRPGLIEQAIEITAVDGRVVVVGICAQNDEMRDGVVDPTHDDETV